jgi:exodeoxyribonuclease VII large subunit
METETINKEANSPKREELTLSELGNRIKGLINCAFPDTYWIRAEMSDVRLNASGHCYLEFVEKHSQSDQLIARMRASIWAKTFYILKPYFERETGQAFASGLKVLVKVAVGYHELYGFSLNVLDIDPTYTVGDMLRRRMEIIRRLKEEGVFSLNKELPFPLLPRRIALITSPTAAGYEDFVNQLTGNKAGYTFYLKLFPAIMQGEKTEGSVIAALEHIFRHIDHFDLVVILRGGGAATELSSFDSYLLAANCAQFPLPVITGIGHERDDTILDLVAHTRLKTPTAVAEFLINCMDTLAAELEELQQQVLTCPTDRILMEMNRLQLSGTRLPSIVASRLGQSRSQLHTLGAALPLSVSGLLNKHANFLLSLQTSMKQSLHSKIASENHSMNLAEQFITMTSPAYILKKGYSLSLKSGKIVKRAAEIAPGDILCTRFADGEITSRVLQEPI